MKARDVLYGVIIAFAAFIAGLLANGFVFAQTKDFPAEWEYKIVDLKWQLMDDKEKPFSAEDAFNPEEMEQRMQGLLNKNAAGGWELVSYAGGTAVYKQKANR